MNWPKYTGNTMAGGVKWWAFGVIAAVAAIQYFFFTGIAMAADGDFCENGLTFQPGVCQKLCDSKKASDPLTCDMTLWGSGLTNSYAFEVARSDGCSHADGTVTLYTRSENDSFGTTDRPWHAIPGGVLDIDATDTTGTSLVVVDGNAAPLMRYVHAVLANTDGCTELTIKVHQR